MSLLKFISSTTFLKQIAFAILLLILGCFLVLQWLKISTHHGSFKTVPDLTGKSINVAQMLLEEHDLRIKVQDSSNYNPHYPKFAIIEQAPLAGTKVKENRKIYLTVNPSGYRKIRIPDLKDKTFRLAKNTLQALEFKIGTIKYVNNIGKDIVLHMSYKDKPIKSGDELPKTATIDLVLGNGNRPQ